MYKQNDKCPVCTRGNLQKRRAAHTYTYKSQQKTIKDVEYFQCDLCEESVENPDSVKRIGKILKEWHKQIDGFLSGEEIRAIRKRIGCTQAIMGLVLGAGEKSIARYENSLLTPSAPMDALLRLLQENPDAFWSLPKARVYAPQRVTLPSTPYQKHTLSVVYRFPEEKTSYSPEHYALNERVA